MKLKVGDVFTIAISNDEVGFGQIVAFPSESTLLISVFDKKQEMGGDFDFDKIVSSRILFLGYTLDAKFYHRHWVVIGNKSVTNVEFPYHRLGTPPDDIYITDYRGKKLRACTVEEFNSLEYETVIAPIRYENALKAYYRMKDWIDEDYNKLLYERTLSSVRVVSKNRHS